MHAFTPDALMTLKEGGWNSLIFHIIDLPYNFLGDDGRGSVGRLNMIQFEGDGVAPVKGVCLCPIEGVAVGR